MGRTFSIAQLGLAGSLVRSFDARACAEVQCTWQRGRKVLHSTWPESELASGGRGTNSGFLKVCKNHVMLILSGAANNKLEGKMDSKDGTYIHVDSWWPRLRKCDDGGVLEGSHVGQPDGIRYVSIPAWTYENYGRSRVGPRLRGLPELESEHLRLQWQADKHACRHMQT